MALFHLVASLGLALLPLQTPETPPDIALHLEELSGDDRRVAFAALQGLRRMDLAPHVGVVRPRLEGLLGTSDILFREAIAQLLLTVDPENAGGRSVIDQIERDNALVEAIWAEDLDAVVTALARGASVDGRYVDRARFLDQGSSLYTPVMAAVITGQEAVLVLLLEYGPDLELERKNRTALHFAVERGDTRSIELLKAAGARGDPEEIAWTARMIRAACRGYSDVPGAGYPLYPGVPRDAGHAEELQALIDSGGDVDVRNPDGFTPLMFAANAGLAENVRTLLAAGADPRLANEGSTALSLARRSLERLESLPAAKGDITDPKEPHALRRLGRTPEVEAKILEFRAVIEALETAD